MSLYSCRKIMVAEDGWLDKLPEYRELPMNREEASEMFSVRTCDLLTLCLGEDWMVGQRFRRTSAFAGIRYSVAACMCNYLSEALRRLNLPISCDMLLQKEAKQFGYDRNYAIKLFNENAPDVEPEYIVFHTEPCDVPKVIDRSPTTGEKIVKIEMSRNLPITAFVPIRETYRRVLNEQFVNNLNTLLLQAKDSGSIQNDLRCDKVMEGISFCNKKELEFLNQYKDIPEIFCGQFIFLEEDGEKCTAKVINLVFGEDDIVIICDTGNMCRHVGMKKYGSRWFLES